MKTVLFGSVLIGVVALVSCELDATPVADVADVAADAGTTLEVGAPVVEAPAAVPVEPVEAPAPAAPAAPATP